MAASYRIIAVIKDGRGERFVKYGSTNLLSFVKFLDNRFEYWKQMNVYDKKTKNFLRSYTPNRRPNSRFINQ